MQFNNFNVPIQLPPGYRSDPMIFNVNFSPNQTDHSLTIPLNNLTGNFHLFISFNDDIPPYYSHNYHYYHQSNPIGASSNTNNSLSYGFKHFGIAERTQSNSPIPQKNLKVFPVNSTSLVCEAISYGGNLDVVFHGSDGQFDPLRFKKVFLVVQTEDYIYADNGDEVTPEQVTVTVGEPVICNGGEFEGKYLGCYLGGKSGKSGKSGDNQGENDQDLDDLELYQSDPTLMGLYEDPDGFDHFHFDDDGVLIDVKAMNNNSVRSKGVDSDFDDEVCGTNNENKKDSDFDSDFDSDNEDENENDAKSTDKHTQSNSTKNSTHSTCENCHQLIPTASVTFHQANCTKFYTYCPQCDSIYLKTDNHTHCSTCSAPTTTFWLQQHEKLYHNNILCECTRVLFEQNTIPNYTPPPQLFPYPSLRHHWLTTCPCRLDKCRYCQNWFQAWVLEKHLVQCGNQEILCAYCNLSITQKGKNTHYIKQHDFDLFHLPDPEQWRKEQLYLDTSAEVQMGVSGIPVVNGRNRVNRGTNSTTTTTTPATTTRIQRNNVHSNTASQNEQLVREMVLEQLQIMGIYALDDIPEITDEVRQAVKAQLGL